MQIYKVSIHEYYYEMSYYQTQSSYSEKLFKNRDKALEFANNLAKEYILKTNKSPKNIDYTLENNIVNLEIKNDYFWGDDFPDYIIDVTECVLELDKDIIYSTSFH